MDHRKFTGASTEKFIRSCFKVYCLNVIDRYCFTVNITGLLNLYSLLEKYLLQLFVGKYRLRRISIKPSACYFCFRIRRFSLFFFYILHSFKMQAVYVSIICRFVALQLILHTFCVSITQDWRFVVNYDIIVHQYFFGKVTLKGASGNHYIHLILFTRPLRSGRIWHKVNF